MEASNCRAVSSANRAMTVSSHQPVRRTIADCEARSHCTHRTDATFHRSAGYSIGLGRRIPAYAVHRRSEYSPIHRDRGRCRNPPPSSGHTTDCRDWTDVLRTPRSVGRRPTACCGRQSCTVPLPGIPGPPPALGGRLTVRATTGTVAAHVCQVFMPGVALALCGRTGEDVSEKPPAPALDAAHHFRSFCGTGIHRSFQVARRIRGGHRHGRACPAQVRGAVAGSVRSACTALDSPPFNLLRHAQAGQGYASPHVKRYAWAVPPAGFEPAILGGSRLRKAGAFSSFATGALTGLLPMDSQDTGGSPSYLTASPQRRSRPGSQAGGVS